MKRHLIAGIGAALLVAGCSGGAGTPRPSPADPSTGTLSNRSAASTAVGTIPDDVHIVMTPGKYRTVAFEPAFTFRTSVTMGGGGDFPDVVSFSRKIYGDDYFAGVMFVRFDKACHADAPNRLTAAPDRLIQCLLHSPYLRVTAKPQPVTVAGVSGQRLDVEVMATPPGPPSCNGDAHPCVRVGTTPSFPPGSDGGLGAPLEAGYSDRIWILDVHGAQVAVFWSDLTEHFASNLSTAENVMQTVRFS